MSEDLSFQQDCSEDFKSPIRTTMLNKYEARDDLVGKDVELKTPSPNDLFLSRPEV